MNGRIIKGVVVSVMLAITSAVVLGYLVHNAQLARSGDVSGQYSMQFSRLSAPLINGNTLLGVQPTDSSYIRVYRIRNASGDVVSYKVNAFNSMITVVE